MKRILLLVSLLIVCGTLTAQNELRPRLKVERQADNCLDFYLYYEDATSYPGTVTVFIDFKILENCSDSPGLQRYEVPSGGDLQRVRVTSLRPSDSARPIIYDFSYRTFFGRVNPRVDTMFVYRMPTAAGRPVEVRRGSALGKLSAEKKVGRNRRALIFETQSGDTVYAMRRGLVVRVRDEQPQDKQGEDSLLLLGSRELVVEQPDGSVARYRFRGGGRLLVGEGDHLLPSTPLGITEGYEHVKCYLLTEFYWNMLDTQNGDFRQQGLVRRHFFPPFATTEGVLIPERGKQYTPVMNEELLTREMTKRELKNRRAARK